MPLITDRKKVLEVYEKAADRRWVVPTFCSENLTSTEAVLCAAKEYGERIGVEDLPVTLAITNLYSHRSQTLNYTHSGRWEIGLKLFMSDIKILCGKDSPYSRLKVMIHLDHIIPDRDHELLKWDMKQFSSIMFDASSMPFEKNIEATAAFVAAHGREIVVEGACDEIIDAGGNEANRPTSPENAEKYLRRTRADMIVANLGTEHRASAADLKYRGDIARKIKKRIGGKIVLHGCSSVSADQITKLFDDGVCKVNIWTAIERDSVPALLEEMARNAAKIAGPATARRLYDEGLLGKSADIASKASLQYFPTCYRQNIMFDGMKKVVAGFLGLWYK